MATSSIIAQPQTKYPPTGKPSANNCGILNLSSGDTRNLIETRDGVWASDKDILMDAGHLNNCETCSRVMLRPVSLQLHSCHRWYPVGFNKRAGMKLRPPGLACLCDTAKLSAVGIVVVVVVTRQPWQERSTLIDRYVKMGRPARPDNTPYPVELSCV